MDEEQKDRGDEDWGDFITIFISAVSGALLSTYIYYKYGSRILNLETGTILDISFTAVKYIFGLAFLIGILWVTSRLIKFGFSIYFEPFSKFYSAVRKRLKLISKIHRFHHFINYEWNPEQSYERNPYLVKLVLFIVLVVLIVILDILILHKINHWFIYTFRIFYIVYSFFGLMYFMGKNVKK